MEEHKLRPVASNICFFGGCGSALLRAVLNCAPHSFDVPGRSCGWRVASELCCAVTRCVQQSSATVRMRGSLPGVRGSPGLAAVSGAAARGRRSRLNTCKGSTHQALLDGPPAGYSHTAELRQASLAFCAAHYPALVPQVEAGAQPVCMGCDVACVLETAARPRGGLQPVPCDPMPPAGSLLVWQRPADYQERRSDGYREPEVIFLCGTAHMSKQSAADVQLLVQVGCRCGRQDAAPRTPLPAPHPAALWAIHLTAAPALHTPPPGQRPCCRPWAVGSAAECAGGGQDPSWRGGSAQVPPPPLALQTVEPENVVIELCKSRLGLIQELPTPEPEQDDAAAAAGQLLAARAASSSQGGSSVDSSSEEGVSRAGSPGGSESASSSTSTSGTSRSDSSSRARKARNALNLSGSSLVEALGRSLSLGGQRGLLLRLLLANQARKASGKCHGWDCSWAWAASVMPSGPSAGPGPRRDGSRRHSCAVRRPQTSLAWRAGPSSGRRPELPTSSTLSWCWGTGAGTGWRRRCWRQ